MTAHSPQHRHCQTFHFGPWRWCIDLVDELIGSDPTAVTALDGEIAGLDAFLPLPPPKDGFVRLIQVEIDQDYAMRTDLAKPIIVAPMRHETTGEDFGHIVIDGWHRVFRARREGRTHLPALLLSQDASRAATIPLDRWFR